jgi:hypothetical protein
MGIANLRVINMHVIVLIQLLVEQRLPKLSPQLVDFLLVTPRGLVHSTQLLLEIFIPHLQCKSIPHCSVQGRIAVLRVCHHPILLLCIIAR